MFRAGLLLIIRRYYYGYTPTGTCHAFMLTGCWQDRDEIYTNWYMSCVYVDWLLAGSGWDISRCTVNKTLNFTYTPTCYGVFRQILTEPGTVHSTSCIRPLNVTVHFTLVHTQAHSFPETEISCPCYNQAKRKQFCMHMATSGAWIWWHHSCNMSMKTSKL